MQAIDPGICHNCRLQQMLAWRMEWTLYPRKCNLTGQDMLAQFPPDSPYTVYHHEAWYGNTWNGTDYGQDYDFSRPFFEQFGELLKKVPLLGQNVLAVQNCEYLTQCGYSRNCYFTIEADHNQDSMFGYRIFYNKNIVDCLEVVKSERCYECIDCENCFQLQYSQLCVQCSDSAFLYDCRSCSNCFGCTGLRKKQFCIFNQQLTQEEYKQRLASLNTSSFQHLQAASAQFEQLKLAQIRKAMIGQQNENVQGNYIFESKDSSDCFNIRGCRDCHHCQVIRDAKDCQDYFVFGDKAEKIFYSQCCGDSIQNLRYCLDCFSGCFDLTYCYQCMQTASHCFGCVGVKKEEYCILNKKYSKEDYEQMIPKIMDHMKQTEEWGQFFPSYLSPYAYNETAAQDYFPLTKDQATSLGLRWKDDLPFTVGKETLTWDQVPEDITQVDDSICDAVLACTITGKNYRITKQELLFYRAMKIPLPRIHLHERHRRRMERRNPRHLWDRQCAKCSTAIQTTYDPERPERVYCEECYLETVY